VRWTVTLVTLILATTQVGTGQGPAKPEPPLAGHCDCEGGICPIGRNGRACSCGCALAADMQPVQSLKAMAVEDCRGGRAGIYPCNEIDLQSFLPLADIGGGHGNDVWGWTDPDTGREYAIAQRTNGTAFVDVTDPSRPRYLGNLPTQTVDSTWRDAKVYADHVFIVSEATNHGMQVFDLRQLRGVEGGPVTFQPTAHYAGFGSTHNLAIDTGAGFAYGVGTRTCAGGLHVVNIQDPANPRTAGCYPADGYTHDTQCIVYDGPDREHTGQEICFASNEDTLTIVDATDKQAQREVSRTGYDASAYTHQGWLTDDRRFFLVDDEGDERAFHRPTRTFVWDVSDLEAPFIAHIYEGPVESIDHNLFIRGDLVYESNYRSGLRLLQIGDLAAGGLREVGFFDLYPADNAAEFNGSWSVFPYFNSGTVLMQGIEQGLFVLRPRRAAQGLRRGIAVSLAATNRPAFVNGELVYIARVVNHGPDRATGIQVTTQLSTSATVLSATSSHGSCTTTSIVTCALGALAAGSDAVATIRVRPASTGDIIATARVSSDPIADDSADNVATNQVRVETPRRELVLRYPNGGETLPLNRLAAIQWTLRGVEGGVRIEYSGDGERWTRLAETPQSLGFQDWVPGLPMPNARVRVTSLADPSLTVTSAGTFTIR
jgi:choice-of-anchor B domain-containing protein